MLGTMPGIMIRAQAYKATELDEYPAHMDYGGQIELQSVDVARDGEAEWLAAVSQACCLACLLSHAIDRVK